LFLSFVSESCCIDSPYDQAYSIILFGLSTFATILVFWNSIGGPWIWSQFSAKLTGSDLSFVNWTASSDMFNAVHVIAKGKEQLGLRAPFRLFQSAVKFIDINLK